MTYDAKEESAQDAQPIMLFAFVQGVTTWNLTSNAFAITKNSVAWDPAVIVPGRFGQSDQMPKDVLNLKLPVDHSLALTFLGYTPDVITTVTVYRGHVDDDEVLVYWKGRVASSTIAGRFMTLECEPIFSSLRRVGVGPTYSLSCRHSLYGAGCRLAAASFAETATVTAVDGAGAVLTITEAAGMDSLVGGTFKAPDGTVRMITGHDGTTVTLMRRIKSLIAEMVAHPGGFEATVYTGCDHSLATCRTKFGNDGNYGGFPKIPTLNPMGGSNVFSK